MKIAVDFDGVLARELLFTSKLPQWLFVIISVFAPALPFVSVLRALARVHDIVVISARPNCYCFNMRVWLLLHRIPVQRVICVGNSCSKAEALAAEKPDLFIDDKGKHIAEAEEQSICAVQFTSWREFAGHAREYGLASTDTLSFAHRFIGTSRIGRTCKKALFRWVANVQAAKQEWQKLLNENIECEPVQTVRINKEELMLFRVHAPFTAFHVTSATAAREILRNRRICPSTRYAAYADQAQHQRVIFFYALSKQAKRFTLFSRWPVRFVIDFLTEEKTTILTFSVPAGALVGMTSWGELVAVEPIEPARIEIVE